MKDYLIWFVMGAIVLVLLGLQFFMIGGRRATAQKEHKSVVDAVKTFETNVVKLAERNKDAKGKKIPTKGDMAGGGEYLNALGDEAQLSAKLWRQYTSALNQYIVDGQVVYPPSYEGKDKKLGEPVTPLLFANFLTQMYLHMFADAEKKLAKEMAPAWVEMLSDSRFALDAIMTQTMARSRAEREGPLYAAQFSHIFLARDLIPIGRDEEFGSSIGENAFQRKRVREWRKFLIMKDIMTRAVAETKVEAERKVIVLERQQEMEDIEISKVPETEIRVSQGWYFIEQISELRITPRKYGNAQIIDLDPALAAETNEKARKELLAKLLKENLPPKVNKKIQTPDYFDCFRVTMKMTAQRAVIDEFMRKILDTKDMYYVPVIAQVRRTPDRESMAGYTIPPLDRSRLSSVDNPGHAYSQQPAVEVSIKSGFEREAPVQATLVYDVYRVRFTDTMNPPPSALSEIRERP